MFSNIGITAAVFFLPLLMKSRGISDLNIGYIALPYSIALFTANAVFGKLTDSYGRQPFLLVGLVASALTTGSYVFPHTVIQFVIARLLNGLSLGMFPAAIMAIASDRGTPMGELSSWRALGWAIGAIINGVIAEVLMLETAFLVSSGLYLAGFVYAFIRDTGGKVDQLRQDDNRRDLPPPEYGQVIRSNWPIYLMVILRHGSGASIWIYWTLFLQTDLRLNTTQIGIVLAINTITQTVVMKFFGDRGNAQSMFWLGILLSALSFYSFPLSQDFIQICLTQILLGISFAFFLVGGLRVAEQRGTTLGMVGTATGLFEASFSISQVIGPILAIIVYAQFQTYTSLMYVAGTITIISSVVYGILIKLR